MGAWLELMADVGGAIALAASLDVWLTPIHAPNVSCDIESEPGGNLGSTSGSHGDTGAMKSPKPLTAILDIFSGGAQVEAPERSIPVPRVEIRASPSILRMLSGLGCCADTMPNVPTRPVATVAMVPVARTQTKLHSKLRSFELIACTAIAPSAMLGPTNQQQADRV